MIPPMQYPDATFLSYAADIKREVAVPVTAVGRLGDPAVAADAIESGKADFVALGRPLIADPDWVAKLARGGAPPPSLARETCGHDGRGGAQKRFVVQAAPRRGTPRVAGQEARRVGSDRC